MSRSTLPSILVLVFMVAFGAIALPSMFAWLTGIENATTGVGTFVQDAAGRLPVVVFLVIGISFLAIIARGK